MKLLFVLLLMFIFIIAMFKVINRDMTYVKSDIDNKMYLVRDLPDKQNAANTLGKLRQNIFILTNHLVKILEEDPSKKLNSIDEPISEYAKYILQLKDRIQNSIIVESTSDSEYTSYSVNKGEQIVFCIRSRKNKNGIHDINLMMYVVLHEMAHVACPEIGHTILFKKIFAFLATEAVNINIYKKINFESSPLEYCGMTITDSII